MDQDRDDVVTWLELPSVRTRIRNRLDAALRPMLGGGSLWADELFPSGTGPFGRATLTPIGPAKRIEIRSVRVDRDGGLDLAVRVTQPVSIRLVALVADRALDPDDAWPYRAIEGTWPRPTDAEGGPDVDLIADLRMQVDHSREIVSCRPEALRIPEAGS